MSNQDKADEKSEISTENSGKPPLGSSDAHALQNSSNAQLQSAQKANVDRHNGSAGGNGHDSFQIFMGDGRIASRLSLAPENENTKANHQASSESISLNELLKKQENENDSIAKSLISQYQSILKMRKGLVRDAAEHDFQDEADQAYKRGKYAPDNAATKTVDAQSMQFGRVENTIHITPGVKSIEDLQQLAHGILDGPIAYLSTKNAVRDSMLKTGPALDTAVDYYSEKLRNVDGKGLAEDIQSLSEAVVTSVSQTIENLKVAQGQKQIGAEAEAMAAFFFVNAKTPIEAQAAKQLNLAGKTEAELSLLGIEGPLAVTKSGERLAFSAESSIEVTKSTGDELNSVWNQSWSARGWAGESLMGRTDVLSRNFPVIDDAMFSEGVFTSMKTLDLNAPTYQDMAMLERKLRGFLDKLDNWTGQVDPWNGQRVAPNRVRQKILQIGIPNGSITSEQAEVFEKTAKLAGELRIKMKVTAIE